MCYCSINDGPSACWESYPVARKNHLCCECGSIIDPGEKYYLIKGVWDGEFDQFKQCMVCRNVWSEAINNGFECIYFEQLWETVGTEFEYAAI